MGIVLQNLSMARRNLIRNWRRTTGTVLSLTIGSMMLLLFGGFTNGVMAVQETGIVGTTGQIHIQRQGYGLYGFGNPTRYSIGDIGPIERMLEDDPFLTSRVKVSTPVLLFNGLISRYDTGASHIMSGEGVDPAGQNRLREWNAYSLSYNPNTPLPLADGEVNEAIVGVGLARMLGFCKQLKVDHCPPDPVVDKQQPAAGTQADDALPGDIAALAGQEARTQDDPMPRINLLTATPTGAPNVVSAVIKHAENQGVAALDSTYVGIPVQAARRLVFGDRADSQATLVVVQLKDTADTMLVKKHLNDLFDERNWPYYAADFTQYFPEYLQTKRMFHTIFGFIAVLMSIIVLFTTSNTMGMSVVERTVEIGTLRAMGVKGRAVEWLFLCEGALLGLLGVVLGVLLSLIAAWLITHSGLTWTPPGRSVRIPLMVNLWGDCGLIVLTCGILLGVAVVSSWAPARRASRRNIVEALRHV